jgi:hypothetical protein
LSSEYPSGETEDVSATPWVYCQTVVSGERKAQLDASCEPYLYQIYGNAAKLVGYATQPDGSLIP